MQNHTVISMTSKRPSKTQVQWRIMKTERIMRFILICVAPIVEIGGAPASLRSGITVKGNGEFRLYSTTGPAEGFELEYEASECNGRFGSRTIFPQPTQEKRMVVVTDGKSVYQSEILVTPNTKSIGRRAAWAVITHGTMPGRVGLGGWIIPQGISLAHNILSSIDSTMDHLPPHLVPEFFQRRASEKHMLLATKVARPANDRLPIVITFFVYADGEKDRAASLPFDENRVLGLVTISEACGNVPTRLEVINNSVHRTKEGGLRASPLSRFTLSGSNSDQVSDRIVSGTAYDDGAVAGVNDLRFAIREGYVLRENDEIPFEGTVSYKALERRIIVLQKTERLNGYKRITVMAMLCAASFGLIFTLSLIKKRNAKTIGLIKNT